MRTHALSREDQPPHLWMVALLILGGSVLSATPPAAAALPANRTYFVMTVDTLGSEEVDSACLTFYETEVCFDPRSRCGPWSAVEGSPNHAFGFDFTITDDTGALVRFDGQGEVEDRGPRHTLAGVARVEIDGASYNLAFVGTPMGYFACMDLRVEFDVRNLPRQIPLDDHCLERAHFGDPAESPYVLPYPAGMAYRLTTTYCGRGHSTAYAYDWNMPLGATIVAAADGVVRNIYDEVPDYVIPTAPGEYESADNYIWIEHDDGTVSTYGHLQLGGMMVEVGDRVVAGQPIARCGSSGTSGPHLHFRIWDSYPPPQPLNPPAIDYENDISTNFRNTDGPVDARGGLIWGEIYEALPEE